MHVRFSGNSGEHDGGVHFILAGGRERVGDKDASNKCIKSKLLNKTKEAKKEDFSLPKAQNGPV